MAAIRHIGARLYAGLTSDVVLVLVGSSLLVGSNARADGPSIEPAHLPRIGTVGERFQSYNIEMEIGRAHV